MTSFFTPFREAYGELADLNATLQVLSWDQQTCMPPKGAEVRARQMATLEGILHEKVIDPRWDDLLAEARARADELTADERAFVREFRLERERRVKLPTALVKELALAQAEGFEAWHSARRKSEFSLFAPCLERLLSLTRQKADCFGWTETPWNALVEDFERGMTAARLREIFAPLETALPALVERIRSAPQVPIRFLAQKWNTARQREFNERVARDLGYDFEAGRLDIAPHPFTTDFGIRDVRITTRYNENSCLDSLSGTIHETGHALFEQGFRGEDERTLLAASPSYGVHESQSRFWEIFIGQSRPFWEHYLPILRQYFPGQLTDVDAETMYRAINRVEPSLIRVDADEVTYNLHILIRFNIELDLLDGRLTVRDLPAEWNRRYRALLGVDVPDDARGCLQDVHWAYGSFSYFPSYTLGNMYAAMLAEAMERDRPMLREDVAAGRFAGILEWLREKIHRVGRRMEAIPLIEQATGECVGSEALLRHLTRKYADIYRLPTIANPSPEGRKEAANNPARKNEKT